MYKHQMLVRNFMTLFENVINEEPQILDLDTRILACKLVLSEALEFCMACGVMPSQFNFSNPTDPQFKLEGFAAPRIIEMSDALGDIQYVIDWSANAFGIDIEPVFDEIHECNLRKLWIESELVYAKPGWSSKRRSPNYYLVKDENGKVMKPPSFRKPEIKKVLIAQGAKNL